MLNVWFIGIPISAFCFNVFLLCAFANKSENKVLKALRVLFVCSAIWTLGDVGMKVHVVLSMEIWQNVSLLGNLLLPTAFYLFLCVMIGEIDYKGLVASAMIACIICGINDTSHFIIRLPVETISMEGSRYYSYNAGIGLFIIIIWYIAFLCYIGVRLHKKLHNNVEQLINLFPSITGFILFCVGNILAQISNAYFPWDTLLGIALNIGVVYVVFQQHLMDVSKAFITGIIYGGAAICLLLPLWNGVKSIESYRARTGMEISILMFVLMVLGVAWYVLVTNGARFVVRHFVVHAHVAKQEVYEAFKEEVSSTLQEDEIYDSILQVVGTILPVLTMRIRIRVMGQKEMQVVRSVSYLRKEGRQLEMIPVTAEFIERLWDEEIHMHNGEIRYDKEVQGFVDIYIEKEKHIQVEELEWFHQICSYASIALKNARLYQATYIASITDDLTDLYSRKYAQQCIVEEFPKDGQASLLYMDIDDLKLYNELYGTEEGDYLLRWFGSVLKKHKGKGKAFRYGSNEFLLHLPNTEIKEAQQIAEQIRRYIQEESGHSQIHAVTISIGIAEFPHVATVRRKLIGYAQRGNFYSKKNGKNCVTVYSRNLEEVRETESAYDQVAPTIYALTAAIDAKDSYTFFHSQNVSEYAAILGEAVGLHKDEIITLRQAGMLHDIGKIGIPESILKKRGKLTKEEYEIMKTHVNNSIKMIHYLPDMSYVIPAVVAHHERYDGKGYPEHLKGDNIPYLGRILSIADCFDAMTARRSYKPPLSSEYAMNEIEKNAGTQFDPDLAKAFVQLIKDGKIMVRKPEDNGPAPLE